MIVQWNSLFTKEIQRVIHMLTRKFLVEITVISLFINTVSELYTVASIVMSNLKKNYIKILARQDVSSKNN